MEGGGEWGGRECMGEDAVYIRVSGSVVLDYLFGVAGSSSRWTA